MMRSYFARQILVRRTQHPRQLVVHQLRDLLTGAHRFHGDHPDRTLAHALHEPGRDFEADVGLEQVAPDVAQRLGHVLLREHSPTGEPLESGGQALGEGRKHKPTKLLSELPESKWGDQRAARVIRIVGTRFQPAQAAGASTSRTTGTVLTSSCLICDRLPVEPPDRRFAQARSSPFLTRAAAALLSHSVYHTSASPPAHRGSPSSARAPGSGRHPSPSRTRRRRWCRPSVVPTTGGSRTRPARPRSALCRNPATRTPARRDDPRPRTARGAGSARWRSA